MVIILVAGLLGYYVSRQVNQILDMTEGLDKTIYRPKQLYRGERVRKSHKGIHSDDHKDLDSLVRKSIIGH